MTHSASKKVARVGWWILTLLIAGVIFFLSSKGSTPVPTPHPLDWIAHTLAYLALGFCFGKASGNWQLAWVCVAWFGALDEVHQAFVPPREAGIVDWWFDLAGSGLGAWLAAGRGTVTRPAPQKMPVLDVQFDESKTSSD